MFLGSLYGVFVQSEIFKISSKRIFKKRRPYSQRKKLQIFRNTRLQKDFRNESFCRTAGASGTKNMESRYNTMTVLTSMKNILSVNILEGKTKLCKPF